MATTSVQTGPGLRMRQQHSKSYSDRERGEIPALFDCQKEGDNMANQPVHVDISQEIQDWKSSRYGRQVRGANVTALTKLQEQTNAAVDYIVQKGDDITQVARDVQTVRQEAQGAVDHANGITSEYKQYADDKLAEAEQERQGAEAAKHGADDAATLAQSWATGGTGIRQGENTDNSAYYSKQSKTEADRAKEEADRASQYSKITAPGFYLDLATSTLYIKAGIGVDFLLDNARLYWKIAT